MSSRGLPVDVRGQRLTGLAGIAAIDKTMGPNLVNHENAQRRIIVTANVAGRDPMGVVVMGIRPVRVCVGMRLVAMEMVVSAHRHGHVDVSAMVSIVAAVRIPVLEHVVAMHVLVLLVRGADRPRAP